MDVSAVILAGGRGRRMGGLNKARLTIGSESFIERQIRICSAWTGDVVAVSNDESFALHLRENYGIIVVPDLYPGEGPLAGIHAGLSAVRHPYAWVLGCDQPYADARAASLLYDRLKREHAQAAVPQLEGRLQPLHAVYVKDAAKAAEDLLFQGERRLTALLDRLKWVEVGEEPFVRHGIDTRFSFDVDTPEDYLKIHLQQ